MQSCLIFKRRDINNPMRQIAVCFLIKNGKVLLLRVHYSEGNEIWNGVSGWVEEDETPEQGIIREIKEEIGVDVKEEDLKRSYETNGKIPFTAFTVSKWRGKPKCGEESIREVKGFNFNEISYEQMIADNKDWLPKILK